MQKHSLNCMRVSGMTRFRVLLACFCAGLWVLRVTFTLHEKHSFCFDICRTLGRYIACHQRWNSSHRACCSFDVLLYVMKYCSCPDLMADISAYITVVLQSTDVLKEHSHVHCALCVQCVCSNQCQSVCSFLMKRPFNNCKNIFQFVLVIIRKLWPCFWTDT